MVYLFNSKDLSVELLCVLLVAYILVGVLDLM